jgi:hypothetical protein
VLGVEELRWPEAAEERRSWLAVVVGRIGTMWE